MKIVIFEDEKWEDFLPLVYMRPVWDLYCGALTLKNKTKIHLPGEYFYSCRSYLNPISLQTNELLENIVDVHEEILLINSRVILNKESVKKIGEQLVTNPGLVNIDSDNNLIWGTAKVEDIREALIEGILNTDEFTTKLRKHGKQVNIEDSFKLAQTIWDLIEFNTEEIINDIHKISDGKKSNAKFGQGVSVINPELIYLGEGVNLMPQVVLDASKGPIFIDANATIMPHAFIQGPAYIGRNATIKTGGLIYSGNTIGDWCKVGGEVEGDVIFMPYSNKQHDGTVGRSYLGSWINIGGGTEISDLKNTYGLIVPSVIGKTVPRPNQFYGAVIGDFTKIGINSSIYCGTMIGINCNLVTNWPINKLVNSFSWIVDKTIEKYEITKAIEVAKLMMSRRKIEMSQEFAAIFMQIPGLTEQKEKQI